MNKYILKFNAENGASFTCESFPTETHSAKESALDCVAHFLFGDWKIKSVSIIDVVPVDGTEEAFEEV